MTDWRTEQFHKTSPITDRFLRLRLTEIEAQATGRERQRVTQIIRRMAKTTDDLAFAEELIEAIVGRRGEG